LFSARLSNYLNCPNLCHKNRPLSLEGGSNIHSGSHYRFSTGRNLPSARAFLCEDFPLRGLRTRKPACRAGCCRRAACTQPGADKAARPILTGQASSGRNMLAPLAIIVCPTQAGVRVIFYYAAGSVSFCPNGAAVRSGNCGW